KITTIGKIIAVNSTAALAFENADDATEILLALRTEKNVVAACLYDKKGKLFAHYTTQRNVGSFPDTPLPAGYIFSSAFLELFEPVIQDGHLQGTLYVRSDLGTMYDRFRLYAIITGTIVLVSLLLAYLLSNILQKSISTPVLNLANTLRTITNQQDYSLRAAKTGNDELGSLTDSFNGMLAQIEDQNRHLSEFNQHLEEKVKERTNQLEIVNKELETFSYSVSHDLRAPLRSITGFTSILEDEYISQLDNEAKRLITRIKSNTLKMGNLVDDLLGFSRMARLDIEKHRMNTQDLVNDVVKELDNGDQEINWQIGVLPDSTADLTIIRQAWINLISNAIKYSRNSVPPRIEIGSYTEGKSIIFFVKDNGVGFDEKYKDKLFQVFQRLHSTNEFEGTGVGLAIVEKIVSKHGGQVWVEAKKKYWGNILFQPAAVNPDN
ncbi:MAG: ATP-binding protein, partial [Ferruginibacter sp.]